MKASTGLRAVAVFEAAKGLIVLGAGSGLLLMVHRDVQAIADRIVHHLHLNPASRYPMIFYRVANAATPGYLRLLAVGAIAYAILRLVEAVGLWRDRRWAEWLGVISAGIYLPFEIRGLLRHPHAEYVAAVAVNLAVIVFLASRLRQRAQAADPTPQTA